MSKIRAVAIVLRANEALLMFRRKEGREYWTFPGGGVEAGETAEHAVVREVAEETTIEVGVERPLYHQLYDDGSEQLFYLCAYMSGEPMVRPDSPEAARMKSGNHYQPQWVSLDDLAKMLVYPLEIRDQLLADIKNRFADCPRQMEQRIVDLRQTP